MGSEDEVSRESTVRTGAEMAELAELAELDRGLAESLVERARREGLQLTGENGLLTGLVKLVLESALQAEMAEHLGYGKGDRAGADSDNARNGTSRKRVLTEVGPVGRDIPRDRAAGSSRRSCPGTPAGCRGSTPRWSPCTPGA
jgi:hypothetical protein